LFHHLMGGEGDPYLLVNQFSFKTREHVERFVGGLQAVVDRHDILRTGVMWEGVREPVQVVWRKAELQVEEVELGEGRGEVAERLYERFDPRKNRIDVRCAPMLRMYIAEDGANERWVMVMLLHHLAGDHSTLEVMWEEVQEQLVWRGEQLV